MPIRVGDRMGRCREISLFPFFLYGFFRVGTVETLFRFSSPFLLPLYGNVRQGEVGCTDRQERLLCDYVVTTRHEIMLMFAARKFHQSVEQPSING